MIQYGDAVIFLLLIFWGHLSFEVVFILRICKIKAVHLNSSLKFEYNPISGCWDIPHYVTFNVGVWVAGWLASQVIIVPLRGLSCKLRLTRLLAELIFQDRPSVAISKFLCLKEPKKCNQSILATHKICYTTFAVFQNKLSLSLLI
jgi:hypothetical protein